MVRTGTKTPGEVNGAKEVPAVEAPATIAKICIRREMKDGPIFKLSIIETGHRPTQFKKITESLPVLCVDKNFQGLDEVRHRPR